MLPRADQRRHHLAIETCTPVLPAGRCSIVRVCVREQQHGGPGRNDEGYSKRKQHCRRGTNGDGAHIWPHQSADESHGKDGRDDAEGGKDRGIAHLCHGLYGYSVQRSAVILREPEMAHHVLDDHDCIVHQDADAEDKGKQSHAVEREPIEVEHRKGESQRDRDGDEYNSRLAPSEEECHQERD